MAGIGFGRTGFGVTGVIDSNVTTGAIQAPSANPTSYTTAGRYPGHSTVTTATPGAPEADGVDEDNIGSAGAVNESTGVQPSPSVRAVAKTRPPADKVTVAPERTRPLEART